MRQIDHDARNKFISSARIEYGDDTKILDRSQVFHVMNKYDLPQPNWLMTNKEFRVGRGLYSLESVNEENPSPTVGVQALPVIDTIVDVSMALPETLNLVPEIDKTYVKFGNHNDLSSIIKSKIFYPVYITGLSGNGKTVMVEQICASLGREFVRANISIETDEDDLIGGMRLVDGQTVFQNGPVAIAMEKGAVLLLDEIDLGSNRLMCLQPVLEGKPVYLKKANRVVYPRPGFNVIATANTKGRGSEDGRFIGTNVMNEAFLERFSITLEQEYPTEKFEKQILANNLGKLKTLTSDDSEFIDRLVRWATVIRNSFMQNAVSEVISTRRLVHIIQAYSIFGNRLKSIEVCVNRFDTDTKTSFIEFYTKLDDNSQITVGPNKGDLS